MKRIIMIIFIISSLVLAEDTWHTTMPDASIADSYHTLTLVIDCFLIKDMDCINELLREERVFILPTGTKVQIQEYREYRRYQLVKVRLKGSTASGWMMRGLLDPN